MQFRTGETVLRTRALLFAAAICDRCGNPEPVLLRRKTMRKAITLALAVLIGAMSLGSFASAQTTRSGQVSITVIIIKDQVDDDDETQQVPRTYRYPSPQTIAKAQDEIASDSYLRSFLLKKRVQLRNVVGIPTAFSGGKIVYVK
jgi:hypothetical protein